MDNKLIDNNYNIDSLFDNIKDMVINSRNRVYSAVNTEMLNLYWNIGRTIMEIQKGDERATYGDAVLDKLSQKLTNEFGKGFSKVTHQDIGQMQMYVNYYDREIKQKDENSTVGILLSTNKNETIVKYTLPEDNKAIFSSEYKLHLPTEKELIDAIEEEKTNLRLNSDDN